MAVDGRRSDRRMVGRWMEVGMADGLAVGHEKGWGYRCHPGGSLRYTLLVLGSVSCKARLSTILDVALSLGHGCLGLGGENESSGSCSVAEVQGRSRGKGRDVQRFRRALLPLYGVTVFAQGIRTITLLRKNS